MKIDWSTYFFSRVILLTVFCCGIFVSCLDEEDAFDEPQTSNKTPELFVDLAIPALLDTAQSCLRLIYPIQIKPNNNSSVIVIINSEADLDEFLLRQSKVLNAQSIGLPLQVEINGSTETINTTSEYQNIIQQCELLSNKDILNSFNSNCFAIQYPITLIDDNSNLIEITSNEILLSTLLTLDTFNVKYPIAAIDISNTKVTIATDFELFTLAKPCLTNNCDTVIINFRETSIGNTYTFVTDVFDANQNKITSENIEYQWYINNTLQAGLNMAESTFDLNENGSYDICVRTKLPNCNTVKETCRIVIIENQNTSNCPNMKFSFAKTNDFIYTFTVDPDVAPSYEFFLWTINDIPEQETGSEMTGDFSNRGPGDYTITVMGLNDSCIDNNDFFSQTITVSFQ